MKIIKPPKLNIGDTIGIVAACSPLTSSLKSGYERGKQVMRDLGFKIKEGQTIGKTKWWMAGSPNEVAIDINSMFADANVKAIMNQSGGSSAVSVIEHLDYKLINNNPKPFIGMSDMTVYQLAIFAKTGQVGFHMDALSQWPLLDKEFFLKFLIENKSPGVIEGVSEWEQWKKGKAQGHLIGGLLERFSILSGSEYFPNSEVFDGSILFWEEVGRDISDIYQYLYHLKNMGIFERISGMLIGKIK